VAQGQLVSTFEFGLYMHLKQSSTSGCSWSPCDSMNAGKRETLNQTQLKNDVVSYVCGWPCLCTWNGPCPGGSSPALRAWPLVPCRFTRSVPVYPYTLISPPPPPWPADSVALQLDSSSLLTSPVGLSLIPLKLSQLKSFEVAQVELKSKLS